MAAPYQPLNYVDQGTNADSCCGPDCAGCCAKPACCLEPAGCCSRVGACPCFCTGSTAAFSVALCAIWLAFPALIIAMSLPDLFIAAIWRPDQFDNYWHYLGLAMWQACDYSVSYYDNQCSDYSGPLDVDEVYNGQGNMFNAMRSLTLVSGLCTLIAALLGAVRLAVQQRSKTIGRPLSWSLIAAATLALATAALAFGFTFTLYGSLPGDGSHIPTRGTAYGFLVGAVGLLAIGVPLHLAAHCSYQRSLTRRCNEQPGMDAFAYAVAPAPVFSHPRPQYFAPVLYPTAAAVVAPTPPSTHGSAMLSSNGANNTVTATPTYGEY